MKLVDIEKMHPNAKKLLITSEEPVNKEFSEERMLIEKITISKRNYMDNQCICVRNFKISKNDQLFSIEDEKGKKHKFMILSNVFPELFNITELKSEERYGKCHDMAIEIAQIFDDGVIETGTIDKIVGNDKIVHSWILLKNSNLVLDYTKNLVCTKETYEEIYNARVLTEILSKSVKEHIELFNTLNIEYCSKLYCIFSENYVKEEQKNYLRNVFNVKTCQNNR